jgi:branched-chain amino acid transport system permease protein
MRVNRGTAVGVGAAVAIVVVLRLLGLQAALVGGVITGAAYGLIALGLVLIYKSSGIFNFAQGEFATVGAYALWLLHTNHVPYLFALAGALVAAIVFGLAVERLIVRPLFDAPRVTLLVATAGVSLLAIGVETWLGEAKIRTVGAALTRVDRIKVFGVVVSDQRLLLLGALAVLAVALGYFFNRTNLGLAILGASQEPTATELVGISVKRLSSFTWGLAAMLGGIAGVLSAPFAGFGPGAFTRAGLIPAFTAAVIGGMTSLPGAFVGGIIVGVAQSVAVSSSAFKSVPGPDAVMVFGLLVVVLAVRPQGLLGKSA